MNEQVMNLIIKSLGVYLIIEGNNGFRYSNIPTNFDVEKEELEYKNHFYKKTRNNFTHDNVSYDTVAFVDVTELKKSMDEKITAMKQQANVEIEALRREINIDDKSGVLSMTGFYENLKTVTLKGKDFVLGMFDIDDFKSLNDTFGHDVGDQTLKAVAQLFKYNIKSTDFIGRFGGDEFLFVMQNTTCEQAKKRIEQLTARMEKGLKFSDDKIIPVTLSIGLTDYDYSITARDNQILADQLLYTSKKNGKNRITINGIDITIETGPSGKQKIVLP